MAGHRAAGPRAGQGGLSVLGASRLARTGKRGAAHGASPSCSSFSVRSAGGGTSSDCSAGGR